MRAFFFLQGCGEVVNTSVCGTDTRGFDSRRSPHFFIIMKFITKSEQETIQIAQDLLSQGNLFIVKGAVGVGKRFGCLWAREY